MDEKNPQTRGKKASAGTDAVGTHEQGCPSVPSREESQTQSQPSPVSPGHSPGELAVAALARHPERYARYVQSVETRLGSRAGHHLADPEGIVLRVLERACRRFDPGRGSFDDYVYGQLRDEIKSAHTRISKHESTHGPLDSLEHAPTATCLVLRLQGASPALRPTVSIA